MNDFEYEQISILYQKLINRPLAKIIKEIPQDKELVPNFRMIQEKIDSKKYISIVDFTIDVRTLFNRAKPLLKDDELSIFAIDDLEIWFEKHLIKIPRTKDELYYCQANKIKKKCDKLRRAMSLAAFSFQPVNIAQMDDDYKRPAPPYLIFEIQKLISEEMKTPEVQRNVASILRSAIPDFNPLAEVHINASSITVELAERIKDYLLKVKKEKKANMLKEDADQTVTD
ncbi:hypothetical protein M9Y10_012974 [Tritrichomonas musculus]|uniref:NET domain-containing protein n=1 Tax=Tritrichomonas musculus TaxID=1915356 RepID=A0ABR2I5Y3_9EUKA